MFIKIGGKIINISLVKNISKMERELSSGIHYYIIIEYIIGEKEIISFYKDKEERDRIIKNIEERFFINL